MLNILERTVKEWRRSGRAERDAPRARLRAMHKLNWVGRADTRSSPMLLSTLGGRLVLHRVSPSPSVRVVSHSCSWIMRPVFEVSQVTHGRLTRSRPVSAVPLFYVSPISAVTEKPVAHTLGVDRPASYLCLTYNIPEYKLLNVSRGKLA